MTWSDQSYGWEQGFVSSSGGGLCLEDGLEDSGYWELGIKPPEIALGVEAKVQCPKCGGTFSKKTNMKNHMKSKMCSNNNPWGEENQMEEEERRENLKMIEEILQMDSESRNTRNKEKMVHSFWEVDNNQEVQLQQVECEGDFYWARAISDLQMLNVAQGGVVIALRELPGGHGELQDGGVIVI